MKRKKDQLIARKKEFKKALNKDLIIKAAFEFDTAMMAQLPDEKDCQHELSPAFEAKMAGLVEDTDACRR